MSHQDQFTYYCQHLQSRKSYHFYSPTNKVEEGGVYFGGNSFVDHLWYLCLVFVMLSHLFIAVLWSPAGKGLTSWLCFVMFNCVFVTFPCGNLDQVWYLIVLIPDHCHLSYFDVHHSPLTMDHGHNSFPELNFHTL